MRARRDLVVFIAVIQSVLFLTHYLLYKTWTFSPEGGEIHGAFWIKLFATRLSVHQFCFARLLPGCCGLDGPAQLPLARCDFLLDYLWSCTASRPRYKLPQDCGIAVRGCDINRTLRCLQRKLDANHADDSAACELAGSLAGAKSGADQRCAFGTCTKRQFSPTHGRKDFRRRAGCDFYRWRFV